MNLNQGWANSVTCSEESSLRQTGGCLLRLYVLMQFISPTLKQTCVEFATTLSFPDTYVICFSSPELLRLSILNISNSTTIIATTKLIPPELFQKDQK